MVYYELARPPYWNFPNNAHHTLLLSLTVMVIKTKMGQFAVKEISHYLHVLCGSCSHRKEGCVLQVPATPKPSPRLDTLQMADPFLPDMGRGRDDGIASDLDTAPSDCESVNPRAVGGNSQRGGGNMGEAVCYSG